MKNLIKGHSQRIFLLCAFLATGVSLGIGQNVSNIGLENFSNDDFAKLIADSKNSTSPIKVSAENGGIKQSYSLNYHGGTRYPHLVRNMANPDILSEIIKGH